MVGTKVVMGACKEEKKRKKKKTLLTPHPPIHTYVCMDVMCSLRRNNYTVITGKAPRIESFHSS